MSRYSGFDQRIANGLDTTIAQTVVLRIDTARINGGVDCDLDRRVPIQVVRDFNQPIRFGRLEFGAVILEPEIPVRGPVIHDTNSAWRANLARFAISSSARLGLAGLRYRSRRAIWAARTNQARIVEVQRSLTDRLSPVDLTFPIEPATPLKARTATRGSQC